MRRDAANAPGLRSKSTIKCRKSIIAPRSPRDNGSRATSLAPANKTISFSPIRDEQSLSDWVARMEPYDDRIPGMDPEHVPFAVDCKWQAN